MRAQRGHFQICVVAAAAILTTGSSKAGAGFCDMASGLTAAAPRAAMFSPAGLFVRTGEPARTPPFGIADDLDSVSAERGGNDHLELSFETLSCVEDGESAQVAGRVRHEGWSNEPSSGDGYPSAYAAPFSETWRRTDGAWRIERWEIGAFGRSPQTKPYPSMGEGWVGVYPR